MADCKQLRAQVPERAKKLSRGRSAVVVAGCSGDAADPGQGGGLGPELARIWAGLYAGGMRGGSAAALIIAGVSGAATFAGALLPQLHCAYLQPSVRGT